MKKRLLLPALLISFFAIILSCSKGEDIALTVEEQAKAKEMEEAADSLHKNFVGTHTHLNTSGSLSQHAHQNLPKKRRLAKKRVESASRKRAAYRQAKARQQERIAKYKKMNEIKKQKSTESDSSTGK